MDAIKTSSHIVSINSSLHTSFQIKFLSKMIFKILLIVQFFSIIHCFSLSGSSSRLASPTSSVVDNVQQQYVRYNPTFLA
jgi:hypothetical protein